MHLLALFLLSKELWENNSTLSSQAIGSYLKLQFSLISGCFVLCNAKILLKAILA